MVSARGQQLPSADRDDATVAGHWLLARLGKRVLRPGGIELTRGLLEHAGLPGSDVVELAPGLGRTATEILAHQPRSYLGAEKDPDAARSVERIVGARGGTVRVADAAETGLPDDSADVVIGEAMLSMQNDAAKNAIIAEAARVLRPGGRYGIHELALTPNSIDEQIKADVQQALATSIRVNARPLTVAEWMQLLAEHELVVDIISTAPMALLEPRRLLADEGLIGALRFAKNLALHRDARRRVLAMRRTFRQHRKQLAGVAIVAHKPGGGANPAVSKGKGCC
ncbi:class I SAM-dependent methyltransferase [[Mycobacterium] nativiensis]|uniref:Class I SAM-dependent methyltransferase n=1 Tax=[Mycobacterium] nativiensis TaxID=2855503 RepID=A0ABU5XVD3_9MYCO|nr:class I SAM-dependent methyltransferase [Mycolicibacter sp. MYC340]MEB3030971.1 class I SAM-dependent methyltransferase [Mycolicibacter sp. MYC340]